ncbi:transcriptional regulator with XRE-family HTH domain [Paenibacillus shirakamiensis]|uniref:Transcriptional regulator with XRE-family HTH domain n=1 Tax=Paenibacillus shirakamiensis TaxID=1265935 RepID=A0ABS4JDC2_9BACL|nr:helix-turn-helix transcriptional regulator [Paenibacillus shirakamiensis]MBP1999717.1 transcriptional regulator with XRE-family HTH domain [Paenibacillus shirakamiensis]
MYKNLRAEMAKSNVTIGEIAEFLGVRYATVSDKMNGKSRFYYDEASKIKHCYFSDCSLEYLFQSENQNTA